MNWKNVLSAMPLWLPLLVVLLASLATRLTAYPKAGGVVTAIPVVLDVLSFLQHKDSPGGALQMPLVQRSNPPDVVQPGPAVLPLLLVFLFPSIAHALADDPPAPPAPVVDPAPSLAPIRAPLVLPAAAAPDPAPIPALDLAGKIGVARGQLDALALQLGVPLPAKIPVQFWDTPAGKGITIGLTVLGGVLAAAQTGAVIYVQLR